MSDESFVKACDKFRKADKILIDAKSIEFAVHYIEIQVATKQGKYHDQPTLLEDIKQLADEGRMPKGYYNLKKALDNADK